MAWPDAASLRSRTDAVGIVPFGALEQHGPHLPLALDALHATALARGVAERLDQPVVVAPVVMLGLSAHHLAFPGTATITEAALAGVTRAYVEAFERMGIGTVALLSGHGGNFEFIGRFARSYRGPARVRAWDDLARFSEVMRSAGRRAGLDPGETDVHAGVLETSVALALLGPERVGDLDAVNGYVVPDPGWLDRFRTDGTHALSEVGVLGNPRGASAEAGAEIIDALVSELVEWIGSFNMSGGIA